MAPSSCFRLSSSDVLHTRYSRSAVAGEAVSTISRVKGVPNVSSAPKGLWSTSAARSQQVQPGYCSHPATLQ